MDVPSDGERAQPRTMVPVHTWKLVSVYFVQARIVTRWSQMLVNVSRYRMRKEMMYRCVVMCGKWSGYGTGTVWKLGSLGIPRLIPGKCSRGTGELESLVST